MIRDRADGRPRIHIWQGERAFAWSVGHSGQLHPAATLGEAVEDAINIIGRKQAVIIWEGNA